MLMLHAEKRFRTSCIIQQLMSRVCDCRVCAFIRNPRVLKICGNALPASAVVIQACHGRDGLSAKMHFPARVAMGMSEDWSLKV